MKTTRKEVYKIYKFIHLNPCMLPIDYSRIKVYYKLTRQGQQALQQPRNPKDL